MPRKMTVVGLVLVGLGIITNFGAALQVLAAWRRGARPLTRLLLMLDNCRVCG